MDDIVITPAVRRYLEAFTLTLYANDDDARAAHEARQEALCDLLTEAIARQTDPASPTDHATASRSAPER